MQTKIEIVTMAVTKLKMYENHLRENDTTVQMLTHSIKEYGVVKPILIDGNGVVVDGEALLKAAIQLTISEVPCIIIDELTDEQIKSLRLVLNKTQEFTTWDFERLAEELAEIEIDLTTYEFPDLKDVSLNISDSDFLQDTEIVRNRDKKGVVCPNCGNEFEL
ncbi:hypothetical protein FMM68_03925 [Lachnospiraceae bacterium MD329]|nr:hypothetical protein [Lachnospiraceae bacterium MD329]